MFFFQRRGFPGLNPLPGGSLGTPLANYLGGIQDYWYFLNWFSSTKVFDIVVALDMLSATYTIDLSALIDAANPSGIINLIAPMYITDNLKPIISLGGHGPTSFGIDDGTNSGALQMTGWAGPQLNTDDNRYYIPGQFSLSNSESDPDPDDEWSISTNPDNGDPDATFNWYDGASPLYCDNCSGSVTLIARDWWRP